MKHFLGTALAVKSLKRVVLYMCLYLAILFLERTSPSGPCVPGLGIIAVMLSIPLTICFALGSLVRTISEDHKNWPVTLIHFIAVLTIYYCLLLN